MRILTMSTNHTHKCIQPVTKVELFYSWYSHDLYCFCSYSTKLVTITICYSLGNPFNLLAVGVCQHRLLSEVLRKQILICGKVSNTVVCGWLELWNLRFVDQDSWSSSNYQGIMWMSLKSKSNISTNHTPCVARIVCQQLLGRTRLAIDEASSAVSQHDSP